MADGLEIASSNDIQDSIHHNPVVAGLAFAGDDDGAHHVLEGWIASGIFGAVADAGGLAGARVGDHDVDGGWLVVGGFVGGDRLCLHGCDGSRDLEGKWSSGASFALCDTLYAYVMGSLVLR